MEPTSKGRSHLEGGAHLVQEILKNMKHEIQILPYTDVPCALQIEITSFCNLKCQMCPLTTGKTLSSQPPGHMTKAIWEAILPVAQDIEKVIVAGYGEPLVNRQCVALLKELNSFDIRMGIATNGIPITEQIAADLAVLPHLLHINISIDSPDADLYRDIRGGDLEKALKGVERLMAAIEDPQRVTVSSVLMHKTLDSLVAFPKILAQLGVKRFCLQGMIEHNPELHDENLLFHTDISTTLDDIRAACEREEIELLFSLPQRLDLELRAPQEARTHYFADLNSNGDITRQCFIPWENPYVDKDGRVFPCCNASIDSACLMGDLREQRFTDIWQGTAYQTFRRQLLDGQTTPAICRHCTTAPLGIHPLSLYTATILFEQSRLDDPAEILLVVQNTGTCEWTQATPVEIGTTNPRDRVSAYFHPSWHSSNRITRLTEKTVSPGEIATFRFRITSVPNGPAEVFQLLVPNICWLPDTGFIICSEKPDSDRVVVPTSIAKQPLKWLLQTSKQSLKQLLLNGHNSIGGVLPDFLRTPLKRIADRYGITPKPAGERWLQVYSAKLLLDQSVLSGQDQLCLIVQNTGTCYWTQDSQLLIGTAQPKDRESAYFHPSWLSTTRIGTFTEETVAPGEAAIFLFQIAEIPNGPTEKFELVLEGKTWLPDTCFEIGSEG